MRKMYVIFFLFLVVFFVGCTQSNFIDTLKKGGETSCDAKAQNLVPQYIRLTDESIGWPRRCTFDYAVLHASSEFPNYITDARRYPYNKWADNASVRDDVCWRIGSNQGENINYLYQIPPDAIGFTKSLDYNQRIISPDGTILGDNYFTAILTLKSVPNSAQKITTSVTGAADTQLYEVIAIRISNCGFVSDVSTNLNKDLNK